MSALGQKQTSKHVRTMSALPPKADIAGRPSRASMASRISRSGGNGSMKEGTVTMNGTVVGTNRGSATAELDNGSVVRGTIAGRLMKNRIRVVTDDRVEIQMTPYDLTKGRITYRFK
jgi:translation initiation factor IF-1